ncbi:SPFH domain-containing protein [Tautonia sp. JC769]|uniref:flotillin family protein n=1 Tax=Tautonia sp. JC769 TaxID=3232135 RepID=UPI00345B3609
MMTLPTPILIAQGDLGANLEANNWWIVGFIIFAIALFSIVTTALRCYKRCPSNKILVKWGAGSGKQAAKCVQGGGELVFPIFQDYDYLSLEPIQIEIPLRGALSFENIRVNVPSVFTVAIGSDPQVQQNAAIRLLGLSREQVSSQASDIIFGQLRQVIASMTIEDINRDREKFLENIQLSLEPELNKIGLVLINVNITDLTDDSGYIEAIGRKAASTAVNQAEIDVAEQQKKGSIGVAKAQQEQAVEVANADKFREIGTKTAERDRTLEVAELSRAQQVGVETARFQQQASVKQAERDMRVQLADADAQAISGENSAKAKVAASNAELNVKQAEAYQIGETRKREAEAAVAEAQYRAQAKAALAEAEKVEAEQRAKLEAQAKAEKARIIVDAEAAAERRRLEARAEADAIFAQLEAEARGQYEQLAKKAEGLKAIVDACGGPQAAFQMLMLEHLDKLSETAAQAISNIKFDKVVVWDGGANGHNGDGSGTGATAGFLRNMAHTLPPMLQIMQEIGGVKMPDYFGQVVNNDSDRPAEAGSANGTAPEPAGAGSSASSSSSGPDPKSNRPGQGQKSSGGNRPSKG